MYLHLIKYSTRLLRVDLGSGARNVFVLFLITRLDPLSPICRKKTPIKSIKVLVHVYQIIFESIIYNYKIPLIRSCNIQPLLIIDCGWSFNDWKLTQSLTTLIFTLISNPRIFRSFSSVPPSSSEKARVGSESERALKKKLIGMGKRKLRWEWGN